MTTTDYWTNAPADTADGPKKEDRAFNWRLLLALSLNLVAWAAILKTM